MARPVRLLLAVVLATSVARAWADVPRDLEDYVILAVQHARIKNLSSVTQGNVGVNTAASGSIARSGLELGKKVTLADGTVAVADQCRLGNGTRVDDLFTNALLSLPASIQVGGSGPTPFGPLPIVANIPPLPAFAPGSGLTVVPKNGSLTLAPGAYGTVMVLNVGTLTLTGGTYEFSTLATGKHARILVAAPSVVNIAKDMRIGDRSAFGPSTPAVGARQVHVNVGGKRVRFGASSNVAIDLLATNAYVSFGRNFFGKGRFIGSKVNTDHSTQWDHPECGDGVLDAGEQCDDGNRTACDGCSSTCQLERCGDGDVCPGTGEQCDDGNTTSCDGCSASCQLESCGDGIVCPSEGEQCDPPQCGVCTSTCQAGPTCGDGHLDVACGEQCDDGNTTSCDGCSPSCHVEGCGDGEVCPGLGEQCDPPSGPAACPSCTSTCQDGPRCGDGVLDAACGEQCDDGNATPCDGCTGCHVDSCGDGTTCPSEGEACDDGNATPCDGCTACQTDRCGDGTTCLTEGEQCDDGNVDPCDGCSPTCQTDRCGDGTTCPAEGEQCDDGNVDACDGCSPTCAFDVCGDTILCTNEGEQCDPPDGATCDDSCQTIVTGPLGFCSLGQAAYGAATGLANDPVSGLVTLHPGVLPVTVGAIGDVSLTVQDQASLVCFLPTSGPAALLCTGLGCSGDMLIDACTNPPILDPNGGFTASGGQGGGALTGELIALKLSVALSAIGATPPGLQNVVLVSPFCVIAGAVPAFFPLSPAIGDGVHTVGDLIALADQALHDPTSFGPSDPITRDDLVTALQTVNAAFDGCHEVCPPPD